MKLVYWSSGSEMRDKNMKKIVGVKYLLHLTPSLPNSLSKVQGVDHLLYLRAPKVRF